MKKIRNEDFKYQRLSQEEQKQRGILGRLVGVCADFINPTRNGRKYDESLWENVFKDPIMKEKINNHICFGELGHPVDREEVDMDKIAICLAEQPVKGSDGKLHAVFDILDTPNGRILKTLCDYGSNIGISSRGTGDLYTDDDGNEAVDPDTYHCECWDAVLIPAVPEARLQYVTESLNTKKYNKTLKQKLVEELNKASEADKKIMNETLNNLDINLNESEYIASVGNCKIYKDGDMYKTTCNGRELKSDDFERLVNTLKGEKDVNEAAYTKDELLDKFGTDDLDLINAGNEEDVELKEKLVDPSEEDLKPIEDKFAELGLEVEGKGETLFGNVHYQLRKELDHNVTSADLGPIFDALCDLDTDSVPTTCSVGVHRDGDNIISASLDVLQKYVPDDDLGEELKNTDGWGDNIPDQLEQTFSNLEDLMYEVRNARRGSYAINGDTVQDLVSELRDLSDQLAMHADDLEFDQDQLNEDTNVQKFGDEDNEENYHSANWYIGGRNNFEISTDDLGGSKRGNAVRYTASRWSHNYKNTQEMEDDIKNLQTMIQIVNDLEAKGFKNSELRESVNAKLNEPVDENCSDKEVEVEEDADLNGDDLMKELQNIITKNSNLEQDNLSLQEKLSVSNAKEIKLKEDIARYKKLATSLSSYSKESKNLKEELLTLNNRLKLKDKLLESKESKIHQSIKENKYLKENGLKTLTKLNTLKEEVKKLNEQLSAKSTEVDKVTNIAKKYKNALNEAKNLYVKSQAQAYGISESDLRSKLTESYSVKDVDSKCNELVQLKSNMSKLPFRINESTKVNFKPSKNEYIKDHILDDDDVVSDSLLSMLN